MLVSKHNNQPNVTSTKSVHMIDRSPPGLTSSVCNDLVGPEGKFVFVPNESKLPIEINTQEYKKREFRILAKPSASGVTPKLPAPMNATTRSFVHRRFRVNSTMTSTTVTLGSLIGSLGVIGTVTNSTVVSVFSAVKLSRIVMWPPQNTGPDRTILEWGASADGGYSPDESFINTIPDGITETRGYAFHPPSKSLLNNWMSTYLTASNIIAYVSAPVGTIIDVHVTACQPNDYVPESISVATAVVGSFYYLALDGATTNLALPVGLPTTH